jgi:hypothetical protein
MTGHRIVSKPEKRHTCSPGWTLELMRRDGLGGPWPEGQKHFVPPKRAQYPPGTVVECECGRTWVSYYPAAKLGMPGVVLFRAEGRIERWRRVRRARKLSL